MNHVFHFSSQEQGDGPEIIYSDELDCNEIGANTELIFDENIPAEFEEEVVSSYDEFVCSPEPISATYSPHPRSILMPQSEIKFKQTLTVSRSLLKTNLRHLQAPKPAHHPAPSSSSAPQSQSKFRETINMKPTNFVLNEHTMRIFKNKIKAIQKRKAQAIAREKKQRPKKEKRVKVISTVSVKKPTVKKPEPVNYIPQKTKPIVDPKNSGEIVRVEKAESDIEVDILSNSEEELVIADLPMEDDLSGSTEDVSIDEPDNLWGNEGPMMLSDPADDAETIRKIQELSETDEATFSLLESIEVPETEVILEASNITNLERFIHSEFFLHRPTKTPERYLKIRNHIIALWDSSKPVYLSKTHARYGLKKCGDVNCISRIHSLLEQMGAINFGCREVGWVRPLKQLYEIFQQNIRNKNINTRNPVHEKKQRIRHSTSIFGAGAQDTNFTISHDGAPLISIDSFESDSMVNRIKSRTMHRTQFELIKCQQFSKDNVAPFQVSISISCLLCLYFHALSSKLEIMGFLGGKCEGGDKLSLTRYKPCRTSNQTAINCEMCPVSQVEQ